MNIRISLLSLLILSAPFARAAEYWAQFRGPGSQGHSDATNLPIKLDDPQNIRWKTPIHGKAWSSPVVWGNQVWLSTATENGKELSVLCVDRDNGKILRDMKLFDVEKPQYCHPFNSFASPTPAIEEGRVYVSFGSPGTACLDTETGKVLWTRTDFVCNHYRAAASSPIIFGNLLLMHFDGSDHQFVVALDKATGKTVWKTNRSVDFQDLTPAGVPKLEGDLRKGFSTPVLIKNDGKDVMLSLGSMAMYAYDPHTGKEQWRVENRECHSGSPVPIVGDGYIYVCMGLSSGQLWAVRLGGQGVVTDTHVLWKVRRDIPTRNSPVLVGGLLYYVSDGGLATCLDPGTGKEVWRQKLKSGYSASPVFADGRIYFFSERGNITVIEPGRQFTLLGENVLDDGFMASPAIAGKAFFLRTRSSLYRIESRP